MSRIRYCENCGSPLQPGVRFCENCGAPVLPEKGQGQVKNPQVQDRPQRSRQPQTSPAHQQEEERRRRYRQERLESDWQQSWDREPPEEDEKAITPVQYVLIGLAVVLLIALIVFGIFWVTGRSTNKSDRDRNAGQTAAVQSEKLESESEGPIVIQDGAGTAKQTETQKQSETSPQTEADIVLNYPEFTVTLPGSWKGKYGITQGADYYTFYQQASKAKGSAGALFTISRYKDTSYKELPNYEVLGTGNGAAFVFRKPTDVQFAADDAAVTQEYQSMAQDVDTIKAGIKILVSGDGPAETEAVQIQTQAQTQPQTQPETQPQTEAQAASGGYIPESSQRAVTESDVSNMSYDDLQMAINEIYARHGRKFNDPDIQAYFNSQPWYQGIIDPDDFSDSVFSATESQNIQYLLKKMGLQ
ncbi:MAG: YARHG domain-containing protein [Lachnospiraceae bacterium]|nr:YARHG domain-containing protein [Lachnospiraceae bacterium]